MNARQEYINQAVKVSKTLNKPLNQFIAIVDNPIHYQVNKAMLEDISNIEKRFSISDYLIIELQF